MEIVPFNSCIFICIQPKTGTAIYSLFFIDKNASVRLSQRLNSYSLLKFWTSRFFVVVESLRLILSFAFVLFFVVVRTLSINLIFDVKWTIIKWIGRLFCLVSSVVIYRYACNCFMLGMAQAEWVSQCHDRYMTFMTDNSSFRINFSCKIIMTEWSSYIIIAYTVL